LLKLKGRGKERKEGKRGMRRHALTAGDEGVREKEKRGGEGGEKSCVKQRDWRMCERKH
jgi:hypothetical protein